MIYLDYNATAPMRTPVREAMQACCLEMPCNPSSVHAAGRKARRMMEEARAVIAQSVSVFPNEIIFTASGTEANNMALRGFDDRPILIAATEHASVRQTASRLGADVIGVDRNGLIDLNILESKLKSLGKPALVSVMAVNNETGVIQPISEIARLVHSYDGLMHCDAVQMLGKAPVDMGLLGADMLTICAHKLGGPVGIGALVLRNDISIKPLLFGGNQELGRRAGSENVLAMVGFAKALELSQQDDWMPRVAKALEDAKNRIRQIVPSVIIPAEDVPRLGHVLNMMTPHLSSEIQLMHLDLAGICVSAGSACSSGRIAPSHVLKSMGYPDIMAGSALRVSAGWNSNAEEIALFTDAWLEMAERLVKKAA